MNTFHKLLFVLAILIANCISASAIEFTVDGVRYSVNDDNATVTVAGYPSGNEPTGNLSIPESVTFRGISFPVTSIGKSAFRDCDGLTSVTIPSSVLYIGNQAFSSCNELTEVVWNAKSCNIGYGYDSSSDSEPGHPFYNCLIMKLIIGDEVQQIPSYLMYKQIFLTSVTIPNSVTSIGKGSFEGCSNLTSVVWNAKNCSDFSYDSSPFKGLTSIKTFKVGNEVERIPAYLCYGLTGLTSVNIGNSVTSIGKGSFEGCSNLTSVVWNAKNCSDFSFSTFYGSTNIKTFEVGSEVERIPARLCDGLTGLTSIKVESGNSVYDSRENCNAIIETATNTLISGCKNTIIPNSVTSIGDEAFYSCSGLTSVTIGNSVTSIGDRAFYECRGLTSVTIGNSVTSIGDRAFYECRGLTSVTIGNSVTEIGRRAFDETAWYNNQPDGLVYAGLVAYKYKGTMPSGTSIVLKEGTKGIAGNAFFRCSGLTSVTIPNSVTSIGDEAFYNCTGLTSVTIPNSVTSIGEWAFFRCSGLTSATIGNSVTSIGEWAFYDCEGLTSVTIGNSVTSIGDKAFWGTAWYNNQPDGLVYAGPVAYKYKGTMASGTSIVLKEGTKGIADEAFRGCSGLTSVTIPNSVTSIGISAFSQCSGLKSVTIPNSVTSIGISAFSQCSGLKSVTIPNSVTSIGDKAFRYCYGLTRIDAYPNPEKVSTGEGAFYEVPKDGTLHVLPKYLSAYRTASQWCEFTNIKDDLTEIGDINLDGNMDVSDVTTLVNMIANGETANLELADINADGKVNVSDVTALINILLK